MTIRRVPIQSATEHQNMMLEGDENDNLPSDSVFINPQTGLVKDGAQGDKLNSLRTDDVEIPKTTWY